MNTHTRQTDAVSEDLAQRREDATMRFFFWATATAVSFVVFGCVLLSKMHEVAFPTYSMVVQVTLDSPLLLTLMSVFLFALVGTLNHMSKPRPS